MNIQDHQFHKKACCPAPHWAPNKRGNCSGRLHDEEGIISVLVNQVSARKRAPARSTSRQHPRPSRIKLGFLKIFIDNCDASKYILQPHKLTTCSTVAISYSLKHTHTHTLKFHQLLLSLTHFFHWLGNTIYLLPKGER